MKIDVYYHGRLQYESYDGDSDEAARNFLNLVDGLQVHVPGQIQEYTLSNKDSDDPDVFVLSKA